MESVKKVLFQAIATMIVFFRFSNQTPHLPHLLQPYDLRQLQQGGDGEAEEEEADQQAEGLQ